MDPEFFQFFLASGVPAVEESTRVDFLARFRRTHFIHVVGNNSSEDYQVPQFENTRTTFLAKFKVPKLNRGLGLFLAGDMIERPASSGVLLYITLLPNNGGWLFEWPALGDAYYRIVLRGQEIDRVIDTTNSMQSYIFNGVGFSAYPPPLEIMPASAGLAPSEINQPFLVIQWYGDLTVARYELQEYLNSEWQDTFAIAELGSTVYTWQSEILVDETIHLYQVVSFNSIDQASDGLAFNITPVVTPPDYVDTDYLIDYDNVGHNITLDFAE